jgi:hypothetical protein
MSKVVKKNKFKLALGLRLESQTTPATIALYLVKLTIVIIGLIRAVKALG